MDKQILLTQAEIHLIHAAAMNYGNKLSEIIKSLPNENTNSLSEKMTQSYDLAVKITAYMEYEEEN